MGSIIAAALYNLLRKAEDSYHYWKTDKYECAVWIITFLSILLIGVEYGLVVGILVLLFLNTHRNQRPNVTVLEQLDSKSDLFFDKQTYGVSYLKSQKGILGVIIQSHIFKVT